MAKFVLSSHLDDAHQLLNFAKGMPDTIGGVRQRGLMLRAAIVFCWLAVEESAKVTVREYEARGYQRKRPQKLMDTIICCLALRLAMQMRFGNDYVPKTHLLAGDDEVDLIVRETLQRGELLESCFARARRSFDSITFKQFRKVRNDLVHCNADTVEPSYFDVQNLYEYCKRMIAEIEAKEVLHQGYDLRRAKWERA